MSVSKVGLPSAFVLGTMLLLPGCGKNNEKPVPIVTLEASTLDDLKSDSVRQSLFNFNGVITINPDVALKIAKSNQNDGAYMIDFANKFNARARELEQRYHDISKLPLKFNRIPKQFNNLDALRKVASVKIDLKDKELLEDLDVAKPELVVHDPAFFDSFKLNSKGNDKNLKKVIQMVPTTSTLVSRITYPHAITIGGNNKFKPETLSLRFYIDSVNPKTDGEIKLGLSFEVESQDRTIEVIISPGNLPFTVIDENDRTNLSGKAMYVIGSNLK